MEREMRKKLALLIMVISLVVAISVVPGTIEDPKEWIHQTSLAKEKVTNLHFYFHETVSGKKITSFKVAQSAITNKSTTAFGLVHIVDDPLTLGPKLSSKLVGRVQGLYGSSSLQEVSLLMVMNFAFTDGKYNGSTLAMLGRNLTLKPLREMPIVGGTGVFRMARGIATAKTVWFNTTSGNAVIEYNVLVIHY